MALHDNFSFSDGRFLYPVLARRLKKSFSAAARPPAEAVCRRFNQWLHRQICPDKLPRMDNFDIPGRIRCGSTACPDIAASLADHTRLLGLLIIEDADVDAGMAAAGGATATAGPRSLLLRHAAGLPFFLRLVDATTPASTEAFALEVNLSRFT
jgi:hypothetical protein